MEHPVINSFQQRFGKPALAVKAPGRINLIGEHTDYNNGFVLPAAISKSVTLAISPRTDNEWHLYATHFDETVVISQDAIRPTGNWSTYLLGVADQLLQAGHPLGGCNIVVSGDIPVGAGLSSSAAVECATVFALNELHGLRLDRLQMVKIAQQAEHRFAGVQCGIMDMFASMMGKKDQVIRLDCRSLEYSYRPLQLDGFHLVLLNSHVKHSLASSAYNERRQQCEQGAAWVPGAQSLRDVSLAQLKQYVLPRDTTVYLRCRYVVEENARLLAACDDLAAGNIHALGRKLYRTHEGLSKEFEVSCPELDYLVGIARQHPDVLGARMMGGGFGGCTLNIVRESAVENFVEDATRRYREAMSLDLSAYIVETAEGTHLLS